MRASSLFLIIVGCLLVASPSAGASKSGGVDVQVCDANGCTGQHFFQSTLGGCDFAVNSTGPAEHHDCGFYDNFGIVRCRVDVRPSASPVPNCQTDL